MLPPDVHNLPLIPPSLTETLYNLERIARQTITNVQIGLSMGDVNKPLGHATQLQCLTRSPLAILSQHG